MPMGVVLLMVLCLLWKMIMNMIKRITGISTQQDMMGLSGHGFSAKNLILFLTMPDMALE
jgi:hypothetical protein